MIAQMNEKQILAVANTVPINSDTSFYSFLFMTLFIQFFN